MKKKAISFALLGALFLILAAKFSLMLIIPAIAAVYIALLLKSKK